MLADGMRLEGTLLGPETTAVGWLAANTAVVGFQEMVTDPAYRDRILAFTYPEVGNVGVAEAFSESSRVQIAGLVVKVLSQCRSHHLSEDDFGSILARGAVPCLTGVDTRALAVHVREEGEMPAAIAPAGSDADEVRASLRSLERPCFKPSGEPAVPAGASGVEVAVINLGIRRSQLAQLGRCCAPVLHPYDAGAEAVLGGGPAGVFVSDGPGGVLPPEETVATVRALRGRVPLMGCGLGHVAIGMALGCQAGLLPRGHHGANCPIRNTQDGRVEVTQQRHTVVLERDSVLENPEVQLVWENMNDGTVEGIRAADGSAMGLQPILAAPRADLVNAHIKEFVAGLCGQ